MILIRKIISILLLLPLLILLSVAYDYFISSDWLGLFMTLALSTIPVILMYIVWPKSKNNTSILKNDQVTTYFNDAKGSRTTNNNVAVGNIENDVKYIDENIKNSNTDNDDIQSDVTEVSNTVENFDFGNVNNIKTSSITESNKKRVTIHTTVVGLKYEGRTQILKDYIKDMIDGETITPFGGMTSSEIKDELIYTDDVIWEVQDEVIPYITVVDEPENEHDSEAMAVYLFDDKIGYVPKGCLNRIKDLRKNGTLIDAIGIIRGGRYKYVDDEDKLRTKTTDLHLNLEMVYEK